jgi:hypothetical protein
MTRPQVDQVFGFKNLISDLKMESIKLELAVIVVFIQRSNILVRKR